MIIALLSAAGKAYVIDTETDQILLTFDHRQDEIPTTLVIEDFYYAIQHEQFKEFTEFVAFKELRNLN